MKQKGFTLIEILIVITIIGVLASIIYSSVNSAREKAKIASARIEVKQIFNSIAILENDTGEWPGHKKPYEIERAMGSNEICGDGCTYGLNDCRSGLVCNPEPPDDYTNWQGPYLKEIPEDPWGNDYFFDTDYDVDPGSGIKWGIVVGSYGPNETGNNLYDNDDIIYILSSE